MGVFSLDPAGQRIVQGVIRETWLEQGGRSCAPTPSEALAGMLGRPRILVIKRKANVLPILIRSVVILSTYLGIPELQTHRNSSKSLTNPSLRPSEVDAVRPLPMPFTIKCEFDGESPHFCQHERNYH